jgi:crotonobetaine/carnitine-CoA ligase
MVRTWRNLWHHTGDLGYIDEDGFVYFVGRQAHWIRRRSENVAAFEIEKAITSHPEVEECAAVGVESSIGDEEIKVYVQLRDGSPGLAPEEIVTWAKERIAYFKVPRYVEFVPDLPRTAAKNEIKRQELKARGIGTAWDRDVAMPGWR